MTNYKAINFGNKFKKFTQHRSPGVIAGMFVVPKGVEHKPVAEDECRIMLVEPKGTVNTGDISTGDISNDRTAQNDVWV